MNIFKGPSAKKGFTLIELLVVVAIISLLSSVVFASLNVARSKARDASRIADVRQMMNAMEIYYNTYGVYPNSGGSTHGPNGSWSNSSDASWTTLQTILANANAISKLPLDPINQVGPVGDPSTGWAQGGYYNIDYVSCGKAYMIVYKLENPSAQVSPGVNYCGTLYNYSGTITTGQSSPN